MNYVITKERKIKMSRTDDYPTPTYLARWAVNYAKKHFELNEYTDIGRTPTRSFRFLEPGGGKNSPFALAASQFFPGSIYSVDSKGKQQTVRKGKIFYIKGTDFLAWKPSKPFHCIVTNPPFSLAEEFIRHSYDLLEPEGMMIMLLKLPFLASIKRIPLWLELPPNEIHVIQRRPSFSSDGHTDATEYAFYCWVKSLKTSNDRVVRPVIFWLDNSLLQNILV